MEEKEIERQRDVQWRNLFFEKRWEKKKIRERCILFCVFLGLEIGMECNK